MQLNGSVIQSGYEVKYKKEIKKNLKSTSKNKQKLQNLCMPTTCGYSSNPYILRILGS